MRVNLAPQQFSIWIIQHITQQNKKLVIEFVPTAFPFCQSYFVCCLQSERFKSHNPLLSKWVSVYQTEGKATVCHSVTVWDECPAASSQTGHTVLPPLSATASWIWDITVSIKQSSNIVTTTQPVVYLYCNISVFLVDIEDFPLVASLWWSYNDWTSAVILCMHACTVCVD